MSRFYLGMLDDAVGLRLERQMKACGNPFHRVVDVGMMI